MVQVGTGGWVILFWQMFTGWFCSIISIAGPLGWLSWASTKYCGWDLGLSVCWQVALVVLRVQQSVALWYAMLCWPLLLPWVQFRHYWVLVVAKDSGFVWVVCLWWIYHLLCVGAVSKGFPVRSVPQFGGGIITLFWSMGLYTMGVVLCLWVHGLLFQPEFGTVQVGFGKLFLWKCRHGGVLSVGGIFVIPVLHQDV